MDYGVSEVILRSTLGFQNHKAGLFSFEVDLNGRQATLNELKRLVEVQTLLKLCIHSVNTPESVLSTLSLNVLFCILLMFLVYFNFVFDFFEHFELSVY